MLIANRLLTSVVVSLLPACISGLAPPFEEQCPLEPSCCEEDCCGQGTSWDPPFCRFDQGATGFNGTYSDSFDKGCVERVCCENACCAQGTAYDVNLASCLPSASFECIPTSGQCASTFSELEQALSIASANDIVAICGNDNPISTEYTLLVDKPNLSLCCFGQLGQCIVLSTGTDRNLKVTGSDFTAQGIAFIDGDGDAPDESGGNMLIDATGDHEIIDCSFQNGGSSGDGGNLAVKKADNVVLTRSSFADGNTAGLGGGVDMDVVESVKIDECTFVNNQANAGGGFHVRNAKKINVKNSEFDGNDATFGGGFFASGLDAVQSLEVLSCTFDGNMASVRGGAGLANLPSLEQFVLNLSGNGGIGNSGEECDDFFFTYRGYPDSADGGEDFLATCVDVDQDITTLPL